MSVRRSSRLRGSSSNEVVVIQDDSSANEMESRDDENVMEVETTTGAVTFTSPEGRLKMNNCCSQTTPGLQLNGPQQATQPNIQQEQMKNEDSDEEQSCPICFETWTNSGPHRLVSLDCGHLFGRSCVERWLKDPKNKCCPQCKKKARRTDIRNIYAKALKAYDTTETEQAKLQLKEERYKRSKAEEGEAKALLQYQLLKQEMDKLKRQVQEQEKQTCTNVAGSSNRQPLAAASSSTFISSQPTQSQTFQLNQTSSAICSKLNKTFVFQKSLQISQKEARVMAYEEQNMLMVVSKPSPNQLFPGYGILKVSSLESRSSEYIRVHQKQVRDAKFNNSGDQLILTASMDKTLKITSAISNSTVQCYDCPSPVWACSWNDSDKNYVYAGLQNGCCLLFDIRKTDACVASIKPRVGVSCPIVSLSYVAKGDENTNLRSEGVLVGTLQGGWFIENNEVFHVDHQLLFPEGACSGLCFDPVTRHCLLSQRPGRKCSRVLHSVCELSGDASSDNPIQAKVIHQIYGGSRAQSLTRSHLFASPEDQNRLLLAAGDEASSSVSLWDTGNRGKEHQKLQATGGAIFDVMTFSAYNATFFATLTEQKLHFYQWQ